MQWHTIPTLLGSSSKNLPAVELVERRDYVSQNMYYVHAITS